MRRNRQIQERIQIRERIQIQEQIQIRERIQIQEKTQEQVQGRRMNLKLIRNRMSQIFGLNLFPVKSVMR